MIYAINWHPYPATMPPGRGHYLVTVDAGGEKYVEVARFVITNYKYPGAYKFVKNPNRRGSITHWAEYPAPARNPE